MDARRLEEVVVSGSLSFLQPPWTINHLTGSEEFRHVSQGLFLHPAGYELSHT